MTNDTRIQLRGNCQRCGALQAATDGHVAHHGYTIKHGWFQGTCNGHGYPALQDRRSYTDEVIAAVRADVVELQRKLELMKAGKIVPLEAASAAHYNAPKIPFAQAQKYFQDQAVQSMIYNTEGRIRAGISFANDMEALADRVHGTPLVEVKIAAAAPRIAAGERKVGANGRVYVASGQEKARVYYKVQRVMADGTTKTFRDWMGTKAWRAMADAPEVAEEAAQ